MAREGDELWQENITRWRSSGLSGTAYCKQESLAYGGRFVYWRRKLSGLPNQIERCSPDLPRRLQPPLGWNPRKA
ncbi:IS66 family insertion sequence element accessory protein TnpA [Ectothiorhodospira variabilis]|uniref:IS66 family insertion sequence element accessory protein TnpA n=1 Tax=Ectothiorhodospira variabilis TaxID=505694 RepID=UPI003B75C437